MQIIQIHYSVFITIKLLLVKWSNAGMGNDIVSKTIGHFP